MTVRVLAEARLELLEAVEHFEREQAGLGRRSWDEVDEHLAWLARILRSRNCGPAATAE